MSIREFGGGLTQVMCLRVKDLSDLQHDRVRFLLEDLEDQALSLKCEALTAKQAPVE